MSDAAIPDRVEAVRRFSRFYTRRIGVLQERLLGSRFSLAEARVIYELACHGTTTAKTLAGELGLDAGYLSRILKNFEKGGLIERRASTADARQNVISLTDAGRAEFATLNTRQRNEIAAMLDSVPAAGQRRLVEAMAEIETLLGDPPSTRVPYILRAHQPGDMGWVIQRHAVLYTREYGWNENVEALTAEIAAGFLRDFDPKRERCWIAEKDGEPVGSVFLVCQSEEVAKLRLLLVEPTARGLGIGKRLVEECIRFARLAGYRKITLWTNDVLAAARRIYQQAGFRLIEEERHRRFGPDLVGQTWELDL